MSFAERLARGRDGDRAALDELFARWRPLLRLQAGQSLGPELCARVDPSDVVQEAWAQAWRQLAEFRGLSEGEWVNWLRCLVVGHAANLRRDHHAEKRSLAREHSVEGIGLADPGPGPSTAAQLREQDARLAAAIEQLPADMRAVVVGRFFHRESFDALAATLGRSPGATRVLWTRALRRLRELLSDD